MYPRWLLLLLLFFGFYPRLDALRWDSGWAFLGLFGRGGWRKNQLSRYYQMGTVREPLDPVGGGKEVYWEEVWKRCELDNLFGKLLIAAALLFELLCKRWEQLLCNFSWTKWYPKQFEVFVQLMAAHRNPKNSSRSEKTETETHKHVPGCLLNLRDCANPR